MRISEFKCVREGFTIRGMEYKPDEDALTAVIISHGFGGHGKNMAHFGTAFAEHGYAAYCFDFCGGSNACQSDGNTTDMTLFTEVEDLKAVAAYVSKLAYIKNIVLMGESQGGFVSALTAAQLGEAVSELILLCPALCIPDDARNGKLGGATYDVNNVPDIIDCPAMRLSRKFHDEVVGINPFDMINRYKGKVLLMHGTDDKTVNFSYAEAAQTAYVENRCRLYPIIGLGHALSRDCPEYIMTVALQFLQGNTEIITADVKTQPETIKRTETGFKKIIPFTATCDTPYFKGSTLPNAEDVHTYINGERMSVRAEYTFEGIDCAGKKCFIHIINRDVNGEWKPVIETDSTALDFLNTADLTAAIEYPPNGVIVHIFAAESPKKKC